MEIKVFKDNSKKENTFGVLTLGQWLLIISLFICLALDICNAFFQFMPALALRLVSFLVIGLTAFNALYRPHGLKFTTWIKLYIKFQTTIQVRTYQKEDERMKKFVSKDFKKEKTITET